jgi:transcription-repair coupling factor (superfamily II helicase)
MYRKDKVLNEVSEKRLQTIREFTEFGSGFKIAMRDLEIRGAGNLLGSEQHGYMDAVGYDLYCKLLDEEVRRLKGESISEDFETLIDISISAFIPGSYIKNEEQKLEIYKKISLIKDDNDYDDIQEEIEDRYGDLPAQVQNLLDIAITKSEAHEKGIISIIQKNSIITMSFKPDANVDIFRLKAMLVEYKGKLIFSSKLQPYLNYMADEDKKLDIKELRQIISKL